MPQIDTLLQKMAEQEVERMVLKSDREGLLFKQGTMRAGPRVTAEQLRLLITEVVPSPALLKDYGTKTIAFDYTGQNGCFAIQAQPDDEGLRVTIEPVYKPATSGVHTSLDAIPYAQRSVTGDLAVLLRSESNNRPFTLGERLRAGFGFVVGGALLPLAIAALAPASEMLDGGTGAKVMAHFDQVLHAVRSTGSLPLLYALGALVFFTLVQLLPLRIYNRILCAGMEVPTGLWAGPLLLILWLLPANLWLNRALGWSGMGSSVLLAVVTSLSGGIPLGVFGAVCSGFARPDEVRKPSIHEAPHLEEAPEAAPHR